jgi:hypothetical protein
MMQSIKTYRNRAAVFLTVLTLFLQGIYIVQDHTDTLKKGGFLSTRAKKQGRR